MKKKVMLAYPNSKWANWTSRTNWDIHPYSLGILASMIENKYDLLIVDANHDDLSEEDFLNIIQKEKPDILGISVLTNEYGQAGDIAAKIAKTVYPGVKTIMGGVHVTTSNPEELLKNSFLDFLIMGEGEYTFPKLCAYILEGGEIPEKGIAYRKDNIIVNTGRADFIYDLDKLPYPAYHKFDVMKYAMKTQREDVGRPREFPYARIVTSRGCPFNCCFCEIGNIAGKKPRLRSVNHILGEIELLIRNYGIKSLVFDDDNLLIDAQRAKDLFKAMIKNGYNLKWNAPALAVYKLDEEMIRLMKESGCQFVDIAIESGVDRVLKDIIHKPVNLEHAKQMAELLKKYNIDLAANIVIGFPGETWQEIRQSIKFMEDLDIDYVKIFIATPCPNTELYRIAKEKNYLREGFSFNQHLWTDGWINTPEFRHQDLRILRAYEWDRVNFSKPEKKKKIAKMMGISEERLDEIRRETLKRANP